MSQLRQGHRCQIDCTNHEEVITGLELKSKDLYFFWRNYEWLYARYEQSLLREPAEPPKQPEIVKEIVTIKESHEKCNREIEELQAANERLTRENKKLRVELEGFRKQVSELENNRYEAEYKKKIASLENKNGEIEAITQKQLTEITKLKTALRAAEEEAEAERLRLVKENGRIKQTVIELQQTIDEFRSRPAQAPQPPPAVKVDGPSLQQIEDFKSKQTMIVSSKMRAMVEQAEVLLAQQYEAMRREYELRVEQVLQSLNQRELASIVVVLDE